MKAPALLFLLATAACAQSMSVHVGQTGAFEPRGSGGGVITGRVDLKTEVQFPEGQNTVVVGGRTSGTQSSATRNGHTVSTNGGAGGYSSITVTPVPVITGPEPRPLTGVPGRELLSLLASPDPSDRLSSAAELGRRPWNPRARRYLTRALAPRLADDSPRVAAAAAHTLAALHDPEAAPAIIPYVRGRDGERLVPMIEALGILADSRATPLLQKLADNIDLSISLAASKALTDLERRQRRREAAPAPPAPPATNR